MKHIFYAILLLLPFTICAQKKITNFDENLNRSVETRFQALEQQRQLLSSKNDSLNREYFYRSKEDHHLGFYQNDNSHYDVILGIIVALLVPGIPIITYFTFSTLNQKLKKAKDGII